MQDDSCHWYFIPFEKKDDFINLSGKIDNTDEDSDERYELINSFDEEFSEYRSNSPHGMRISIS